ncbi:MAG: hypothetical protein PUF32_10010 [Prevotella sp.]|nr:hypothetical protein [Prevotella sp.]
MKTIKKVYTVPCTIVCKMQMEGVMTSASPTSLSTTNESELTNANTQGNKDISIIGGTEQHSGGDDLDAAKKLNLFYDEE